MSNKSLSERKKQFLEDCCGGGPTMSMGDAGFDGASPAVGPTAGFDPILGGKKKKSRPVDMAKKLRKEGYKPLTDKKKKDMLDKANDKATKAYDKEQENDEFDPRPEYKKAWRMQTVSQGEDTGGRKLGSPDDKKGLRPNLKRLEKKNELDDTGPGLRG